MEEVGTSFDLDVMKIVYSSYFTKINRRLKKERMLSYMTPGGKKGMNFPSLLEKKNINQKRTVNVISCHQFSLHFFIFFRKLLSGKLY